MRTKSSAAIALLALSLATGAALAQAPGGGPGGPGGPGGGGRGGGGGFVISSTMLVESNSFPDGGIIPTKNSMQGGVQPDFKITGIPAGAQSVVLIFHDIEIVSGGTTGIDDNLHWMAWNIPVNNGTAVLEEGKLPQGATSGGGRGGAYMGPGAPAAVRYHHYVFDFYAINTKLELPATATRAEVTEALRGKIVGKAAYVGRFHGEQGAGGGGGGGFGGRGPGGPGGPPPGR